MDNSDISFPWVEEFRPSKIEDVIGDVYLIEKLNEYITNKSIPNLAFVGNAGTGKTSIAKILADSICGKRQYLNINASERNNIETIRTDVIDYCGTSGFGDSIKIIILDEFDGMTIQAQRSLKAVMEEYSKNCRFILTANAKNKIIDPIQSRCQMFEFSENSKLSITKRCIHILNTKKIKPKNSKEELIQNVKQLVLDYYPDIRLTINTLQKHSANGVFFYDSTDKKIEYKQQLVDGIKTGNLKSIRDNLLSSAVDYAIFYDILYSNLKEITEVPEKISAIIIVISEYMYRHSTHINSEINFMACLIEIRNVLRG